MEIKTKFALGDTVWTVANCRAASFEISAILFDGCTYYGPTRYDLTEESMCFGTKEELLKHVADGN